MTEPKAQHPMFEPGDKIAVEFTVIDEINDGRVRASLEGVAGGFLFPRDTAFRPTERAPRPLVPGPAEYINSRDRLRVTVVAVHNGQAWVKMPDGVLVTEIHPDRLRNTEGAAS